MRASTNKTFHALLLRARVPQRPAFVSSAGNPDSLIVGATNPGLLFFAYFLFAEAKESRLLSGNPRLLNYATKQAVALCEKTKVRGIRLRGYDKTTVGCRPYLTNPLEKSTINLVAK